MSLLLATIVALTTVTPRVEVDASGHVTVSPEERAREQNAQTLLRDAENYYKARPHESRVAIEKYETVLREVELHPKVKEDIRFKLATLHEEVARSFQNRGSAELRGTDLNRALGYYADILSQGLDETRPVLLAETLLHMGDIKRELGKNRDAVQCFLRARTLARDQARPAEEPGTAPRRTSVETAALSKTVTALDKPEYAHIRNRVMRENPDDLELANALARIPDAREPIRVPPSPAIGRLGETVALALGTITVGLIALMRQGLQQKAATDGSATAQEMEEET